MNLSDNNSNYRLAILTAAIAGAFSLVVCALLFYDYSRRSDTDPLEIETYQTLKAALAKQPENTDLKSQIRSLDLRLRREYFRQRAFTVVGAILLLGGVAIFRFPHLHDGELRKVAPKRDRMVWRKDYRYYYLLNLLDGVRQQVFFSFGLWVLVNRFKLGVEDISLLLMTVTFVGIVSSSYVGRLIDRLGERRILQAINIGYVVALGGYALSGRVYLACVFYVIYSFISQFSTIGASTYLRKIAVPEEIAPTLAMGVTILHATAIVVPVAAGIILNFVGYRIPFFIACIASLVMVGVTQRLDPARQRTAARMALDEARLASRAGLQATAIDDGASS